MEGITILNEFTTTGAILAPWMGIGLTAVIVGIVGLVVCTIIDKPCSISLLILTIFFGVSSIFGFTVGALAPREQTINYQVLIDESVNLVEFYENYEIIGQDGFIYTIVEKME